MKRIKGSAEESGEPYLLHPVAVASVVAEMGLDDVSIAAALLHDAVEDTGIELLEIGSEFGSDVAALVDGVTKLDRVRFATKQAQQAATLRKMLVAMAQDLRVLLVKLMNRLHNVADSWRPTTHETRTNRAWKLSMCARRSSPPRDARGAKRT